MTATLPPLPDPVSGTHIQTARGSEYRLLSGSYSPNDAMFSAFQMLAFGKAAQAALALQQAPIVAPVEPTIYQSRMQSAVFDGVSWTRWAECSANVYRMRVEEPVSDSWRYEARALYLAAPSVQPVQPTPLDDDQIISVLCDCNAMPDCDIDMSDLIHVVRCVEAAHGICAPAIDQTKGGAK